MAKDETPTTRPDLELFTDEELVLELLERHDVSIIYLQKTGVPVAGVEPGRIACNILRRCQGPMDRLLAESAKLTSGLASEALQQESQGRIV